MLRKKPVFIAAILVMIVFIAVSKLHGSREEGESLQKNSTEIRVGVLSIDDVLPIVVAEEEKAFLEEGLKVKIFPFKSSLDQSKAMEAGELDIIMNDMIVQSFLKKAGVDTKVISYAFGANVQEGRFVVVASPKSKIQKPEDLYGKKVAISTNTMMEYLMEQYEKNLHLDSAQIEKVNIPNLMLRLETVLEGRDIEAAILPDPLASFAIQKGCVAVIDDTKLSENFSQSVILVRDDFMEKEKNILKSFMKVYFETMIKINENPEKYKEIAMKNARVPEALKEDYQTPHFTPYQVPKEEEVKRVTEWMRQKGLVEQEYSYEELVSQELIDAK